MSARSTPIALLAAAALLGCDPAVVEPGGAPAFAIRPPTVQVGTGRAVNFAMTGAANTPVTWSIEEGTPAGGSITQGGTYTAPLTAGTFHVVAQSQGDASKTARATVTVVQVAPPPASAQACATEPIDTTGTVYYACDCQPGADPSCAIGNDTNAGTSPDAPFRTYTKARGKFSGLPAGGTIAFCQGGFFNNDNPKWTDTNCSAAKPCTIRDYVDPRWTAVIPGQRPILKSGSGARGMDLSSAQTGIRVLNLKLLGDGRQDGLALAGPGSGPSTDIAVCNVEVDGYWNGIEFYQASPSLTVVGSRFVNNHQQGILGGSNDTIIEDNTFDNNGWNPAPYPISQGHGGIYVSVHYNSDPSRFPGGVTNMTIRGNSMTDNSLLDGVCQATPLVVHAAIDGLLIENNYIDGRGPSGAVNGSANNGGCFGIMLGPGAYPEITYFRRVSILRNRLIYTGYVGIATSECTSCVVDDNLILVGYPGASQDVTAIQVPHDLKRSGDPDANSGTVVRNNTIYLGPSSRGEAVQFKNEGTGYVASSNAVYYDGSSTGGFSCFAIATPSEILAMDHNSCYRPSAPSASWAGVGATGYSLSAWTSGFGFDAQSQQSNPLFTSLTEPWNFTPCLMGDPGCPGTSPLIGAADPVHYSPIAIGTVIWDPADPGKARGASPDIGAYQR